jgi:hypothetical protein
MGVCYNGLHIGFVLEEARVKRRLRQGRMGKAAFKEWYGDNLCEWYSHTEKEDGDGSSHSD